MSAIKELDVPVVSIDFLDDATKGGALLKIPTHTISPWGAPRHSLAVEQPDLGRAFKSKGSSLLSALFGVPHSRLLHRTIEDEGDSEGGSCSGPRVRSVGCHGNQLAASVVVLCAQVWRRATTSWRREGRFGMLCWGWWTLPGGPTLTTSYSFWRQTRGGATMCSVRGGVSVPPLEGPSVR